MKPPIVIVRRSWPSRIVTAIGVALAAFAVVVASTAFPLTIEVS